MNAKQSGRADETDWLRMVRTSVESLQFGVVEIVVHDGRVVQIERREKMRLDAPEGSRTGRPS